MRCVFMGNELTRFFFVWKLALIFVFFYVFIFTWESKRLTKLLENDCESYKRELWSRECLNAFHTNCWNFHVKLKVFSEHKKCIFLCFLLKYRQTQVGLKNHRIFPFKNLLLTISKVSFFFHKAYFCSNISLFIPKKYQYSLMFF